MRIIHRLGGRSHRAALARPRGGRPDSVHPRCDRVWRRQARKQGLDVRHPVRTRRRGEGEGRDGVSSRRALQGRRTAQGFWGRHPPRRMARARQWRARTRDDTHGILGTRRGEARFGRVSRCFVRCVPEGCRHMVSGAEGRRPGALSGGHTRPRTHHRLQRHALQRVDGLLEQRLLLDADTQDVRHAAQARRPRCVRLRHSPHRTRRVLAEVLVRVRTSRCTEGCCARQAQVVSR